MNVLRQDSPMDVVAVLEDDPSGWIKALGALLGIKH